MADQLKKCYNVHKNSALRDCTAVPLQMLNACDVTRKWQDRWFFDEKEGYQTVLSGIIR